MSRNVASLIAPVFQIVLCHTVKLLPQAKTSSHILLLETLYDSVVNVSPWQVCPLSSINQGPVGVSQVQLKSDGDSVLLRVRATENITKTQKPFKNV